MGFKHRANRRSHIRRNRQPLRSRLRAQNLRRLVVDDFDSPRVDAHALIVRIRRVQSLWRLLEKPATKVGPGRTISL